MLGAWWTRCLRLQDGTLQSPRPRSRVPFSVSLPDRSILHRESYMKNPSIEVSALAVSAIITLALGEWWHWVAVIAAIVVVHVLRRT
jgi:hypothetical protein